VSAAGLLAVWSIVAVPAGGRSVAINSCQFELSPAGGEPSRRRHTVRPLPMGAFVTMYPPVCGADGHTLTWSWSTLPDVENYHVQISTQKAQLSIGSFREVDTTQNGWVMGNSISLIVTPGLTYYGLVVNWDERSMREPVSNMANGVCSPA
jgi:hypothetical protein